LEPTFLPSGGAAMTFKKIVSTCIVICIMATLGVAMIGCDDLGAYEDTDEYYNSFGEIALISGTSEDKADYVPYSVKESFYNEKSREDFIAEEDDAYKRVAYSDYVYMAIPFRSSINMDAIALYLQSQKEVTVYIDVFVTDYIPTEWKAIADHLIPGEETGKSPDETFGEETEKVEKVYDDPTLDKKVGEITVRLKSGKWGSFVLDNFYVNGTTQKSIEIKKDHYILLQIKNNSGVYVDPRTETDLRKAEITMTNLLIRALDIKNETEVQGGE
jgi:hypothetical protein